jgi:hypothetical protein
LQNNNLFDSETLKQIQENLIPEADNVGKGQDLLWKVNFMFFINFLFSARNEIILKTFNMFCSQKTQLSIIMRLRSVQQKYLIQ